jgi:hypothetical protein
MNGFDKIRERFIQCFSSDPFILSFVLRICNLKDDQYSGDLAHYSALVLYECLSFDKPEIIKTYLEIHYMLKNIKENGFINASQAMNLLCVIEHTKHSRLLNRDSLIDCAFIDLLSNQIDEFYKSNPRLEPILQNYITNGFLTASPDRQLLYSFLKYYGWPINDFMSFKKNIHDIFSKYSVNVGIIVCKSRFPLVSVKTIFSILDISKTLI